MRTFIFTIFFFVHFFICYTHGQKNIEAIFEVEIIESEYGGTYISYTDKNWDKYKSSPVFIYKESSARDLISFNFNSISKKDSIEQSLFNREELDTLNRGFAMCQIHIPSGRIVSVSFSIPVENRVQNERLLRYKKEIEKNLYFEVTLYSELEKEGYLVQSFPIFISRNKN